MDTQISCYWVLGQTTNDWRTVLFGYLLRIDRYIRFELTIVRDDSCKDKSSRHAYITKDDVYIFVRYIKEDIEYVLC